MPYAIHHFKPRPYGRGFFYVQDKVRPETGREGALGYERYAANAGLTVIDNTGLGIIKDIKVKLTLRFGHDGRNHGISGYIHNRTGHVQ